MRRQNAQFSDAYEKGDAVKEEPIGIVIESEEKTREGRKFSVYELWDFERWNYAKCRLYFKALVLWLEKAMQLRLLRFHGIEWQRDILRGVLSGDLLLVEAIKARPFGSVWYPDDYADSPGRSVKSKEAAELPLVLETYRECRLDAQLEELKQLGILI